MPIAFDCPGCRKPYTVEDALAGQKARCKHCGREFRIPGAPPIHIVPIDVPPAAPSSAPTPTPRPAVAAPPPAPAIPPPPVVQSGPAGPLPRLRPWEPPADPLPADSPLRAIDTTPRATPPAKAAIPDLAEAPRPAMPAKAVILAAAGIAGLLILAGLWMFATVEPVASPENDPEAAQGEPAPTSTAAGAPAPTTAVAASPKPVAGPRLVLSAGTARRAGDSLTFRATCRANPGEDVGEGIVWVIQTPSTTVKIPVSAPAPGAEAALEQSAPEDIRPGDPGPFLSYLALPGEGDLLIPVSNSLPLRAVAADEPAPDPKPKASTKKAADPFAPPRPPF